MNARSLFRILPLAFAALALPLGAAAVEQQTLLASDGTLYTVRAGTVRELATSAYAPASNDFAIQWSARTQSGGTYGGTIPGTTGATIKKNLQLAYDEMTGSLLLLWKEEVSLLNVLHLGILHGIDWRVSDLLPNLGFPHAYNPQMVLTHQTVHYVDSSGNDATRIRPILSVLWWEEANSMQARYAPIFLDNDSDDSDDVQIFDLPVTIGSGPGSTDNGAPAAAYQYPAIRVDGSNGELAASFVDLASGKHRVVRITFPDHLGNPSASDNVTWQRRRIPVVGVAFEGPIAGGNTVPRDLAISTIIGPTYRPTLVWSDGRSIGYARTNENGWSAPRSIPITPELPYDRAMRLVEEMANRN